MKLLRLDKIIADNTSLSRSEVQKLAKNGLIIVNGQTCTKVSEKFSLDNLEIIVDGEQINFAHPKVLVFHKPKGVICANNDPYGSLNVFHLLPSTYHQFHTVGRLDKDTTGLLLITDDGNFSHQLTSPRKHVSKKYFVTLEEPALESYQEVITEGILLHGETDKTKPGIIEFTDNPFQVYLTITEGRYHQVKRMFAALNNKVIDLHRVSIGNLDLPADLAEGEYFELSVPQALELVYGEK
ncbi:pseudouridine synthase [Psittacicella gerlachiana]|uniref:Pseudouridine synthase n=1 Tax=Psittacicella gerlachiana TaxID=2028574 RepID=A0A3A1YH50_9GAMM|nr:pseudouridine synthase [Psittacicella gerlachiana]RIY35367.1 hypothetical protein CKF59_03695 [Psittacicella gerlachiana]